MGDTESEKTRYMRKRGLVVAMNTWEAKQEDRSNKSRLGTRKLYLDYDFTQREIGKKIKIVAQKKRKQGKTDRRGEPQSTST